MKQENLVENTKYQIVLKALMDVAQTEKPTRLMKSEATVTQVI